MQTKLFEIRDRFTLIPAMATLLDRHALPDTQAWLLVRAGFHGGRYVSLTKLADGSMETRYNPHSWDSAAMTAAHIHILGRWNDLKSGDVVDAEFLRGETAAPKVSERLL